MKRKINLVGNTTLTVSLPSKWVKRNNLSKGDEIEMEENGQQLLINLGVVKKTLNEITINFDDEANSSLVWRYMKSVYTQGYGIIIVNFTRKTIPYTSKDSIVIDKKEISTEAFIHLVANRMFGVVLVEQSKNRFILNNIGIDTNIDVNELAKKISSQIKILAGRILSAIESGDKMEYNNIVVIENNINNLEDYGIRILNKTKDNTAYGEKYLFLTFLEHIGDIFYNIFGRVVEHGLPFTKEAKEYYLELMNKYEKFHNAVWYNKKEIPKVFLEIRDFEKELIKYGKNNILLMDFANLCSEMGSCIQTILYSLCESRVVDE